MQRDTAISISKAFGIIFMVMSHAGCPSLLGRFFGEFIMPLFFMTAGYFFSLRYVSDWSSFVKKRVKGLYWPFVKWSVIFLALHNVFFAVGLLNEQYGTPSGGLVHPYTWHTFEQRLWNVVTAMGSYDEFLNGAFWFFRALFVASLLYLAIFKLYDSAAKRILKKEPNRWVIPVAVTLTALLLALWKTGEGLRVITLVQGGYRDIVGTFFFGCGYLWRQLKPHYKTTWWATLLLLSVVVAFTAFAPAGMPWRGSLAECLSLPVPAVCGVLMIYNVSCYIDRLGGLTRKFLVYCGDNTLYVLVFHFLAFKLASAAKIFYYGLDRAQIGCHPVVNVNGDDLFWIVYAFCGVALPLLCLWLYRTMASRMASTMR